MKNKIAIILLTVILLESACVLAPGQKYEEDDKAPKIEEARNLFVEQNDGSILFDTNDSQYIRNNGYTLWGLSDEAESQFTSRTLNLTKKSGVSILAGYGGIYCYTNDPDYGQTFLTVLINRNQEYCAGEVINNFQFNYLVPWTKTDKLYNGFGQKNEVTLSYDNEDGFFHLYINKHEVTSFRDDEEPIHLSGKQGYVVTISPLDKFPEEAVQVVFEEGDAIE